MAKKEVLPPGVRFHPTDVELLKYYLKKKILGQSCFGAIQEVNIYEYEPSELPSLACLKRSDQKWYFFCHKERKYGHGDRAKRSTRGGFWKTTGKDRPVMDNDVVVGMIKSLIFHEGRAANGSRTDWVMHEYSLKDPNLAAKKIPQDNYVICVIFKKDGRGPRNGAQYGAPFKEQEWEDHGISFQLSSDLLIGATGLIRAPIQDEQQGHFARIQDDSNNDLSKSVDVIGSPHSVSMAHEAEISELSGPVLSTPTAVIGHSNNSTMKVSVHDNNPSWMSPDEILDIINTSVVNNDNQTVAAGPNTDAVLTTTTGPDVHALLATPTAEETQGAAAGSDEAQTTLAGPGGTQTALVDPIVDAALPDTASEDGIYDDLSSLNVELDVSSLNVELDANLPPGNGSVRFDGHHLAVGFMELSDLESSFTQVFRKRSYLEMLGINTKMNGHG
ncbi:hypothetical protein SAY86_010166 [Trapa natans]|uniref:NAC domain-containing protein n=1 Tax=Trapa natans TaxID=22666 RepID=A0AAN7QRV4_TRANT|nr:hypothetical protein SAY86_010166 [Trapa natans]